MRYNPPCMSKRPAAIVAAYIKALPGDSVYRVSGVRAAGGAEDLIYRRGEAAAETGDWALALAAFRLYLRRTPRSGGNLFQIFNAACLTGDFGRAFSALGRINARGFSTLQKMEIANPWYLVHDQALLRSLATLLAAVPASGREPYRTAYLLTLRSAAGLCAGAELSRLLRRFRSLRSGPGRDTWLYFKAGETALNLCAYAEAEELLAGVLRAESGNLQARGRLAEALICQGREREGLRLLIGGEAPSLRVWHGEILLWLGRYSSALGKLQASGAASHHLSWCWRGAALFKLGRVSEALRDLDRAIELRPGDTEALVWRSEALEATGRFEAALKDLRAAAKINPGHLWARTGLTLHWLREGDMLRALENFKLPPAFTARLAAAAGIRRNGPYSGIEIQKLLLLARRLARGCRRHEPYLLPLWLPDAGKANRTPAR